MDHVALQGAAARTLAGISSGRARERSLVALRAAASPLAVVAVAAAARWSGANAPLTSRPLDGGAPGSEVSPADLLQRLDIRRACSATTCFSRPFSRSSSCRRLAPSAFIPPYWLCRRCNLGSDTARWRSASAMSLPSSSSRSASRSLRTIRSGVHGPSTAGRGAALDRRPLVVLSPLEYAVIRHLLKDWSARCGG